MARCVRRKVNSPDYGDYYKKYIALKDAFRELLSSN